MVSDEIGIMEKGGIPADAKLPTDQGDFRIRVFHDAESGLDHVALTLGEMEGPNPVLVRVHSECLTGDAFGSLRCDCGPQLNAAIRQIQEVGWGCIVYLRQEGADTVEANLLLGHPADARDYSIASKIIKAVGIHNVCLLTNNPDKVKQLTLNGTIVSERMPLIVGIGDENREYMAIKVDKMGHDIPDGELEG